jgi:hypothetical protein
MQFVSGYRIDAGQPQSEMKAIRRKKQKNSGAALTGLFLAALLVVLLLLRMLTFIVGHGRHRF